MLKKIFSKNPLYILFIVIYSFGQDYNEALAKAIYFYECQQAGPLPSWNRVEWRADATMQDDVLGGWYDAGDHVKFNLPMAYSASLIGWGAYEYGSNKDLDNNLKFVLDYLADCWNGSSYTYQVGDGNNDHGWWGPVEVIHFEEQAGNRPSFSASSGLSSVMAQTAAALAIGNILYGNSTYLSKAEQLYSKANSDRSDANYSAANGFYDSWSGPIDEIMWAAIWLYLATNSSSYLSNAESLVSQLEKEDQTDIIGYKWGHCWDDCHYGDLCMLAKITGKQEYIDFMQNHLDWWVAGAKGKTPSGLSWLDSWGCLRYASTEAFLAFVYSDWSGANASKASTYSSWAKSQIDYCLGSNERNGSYVVGYGSNSPQHPHHRTSHSSWTDQKTVPENHRHILYGALVGGPNQSGSYTDDIEDYVCNEVACDYNAGLVSSLCKLANPGSASFNPPSETKDVEFFVEAQLNSSGNTYTEIKALVNNRSGWPARVIKDLNFNYYFDLSEVFDAGYTVDDIKLTTNYTEFPVTLSSVLHYDGTVYYVNISFDDGTSIYPGGQSEYAAEVQVRIAAPDGTDFWDPSNDYSYQELSNSAILTEYITLYDGNKIIWGIEPNGSATFPPKQKHLVQKTYHSDRIYAVPVSSKSSNSRVKIFLPSNLSKQYSLNIINPYGKVVRSFNPSPSANNPVYWNCLDNNGSKVSSGWYMINLIAPGKNLNTGFLLMH